MQEQIQKLQAKMDMELDEMSQLADPIERYVFSIKAVIGTIEELKTFISAYQFQDKKEEINYFRVISPNFFSKYFYFLKVYNIELLKKSTSKDNLRMVYDHELKGIDLFFTRNDDFCRQYYLGSPFQDERAFIRHSDASQWALDDLAPVIDDSFTVASYKVSWIIANQRYRLYLEREMRRMAVPESEGPEKQEDTDTYEFKGTKSSLVEAVTSIQASGVLWINGKPSTLVQLAEKAEKLFSTDLKDISHLDYSNRLRKKELHPFLNSLIKAYIDRANRLNE